jgi:hypothetical protein
LTPRRRSRGGLGKVHELERASGVIREEGRGWYGLRRRAATDETPKYSNAPRVLNKLGAWAAGSTTHAGVYQDGQNDDVSAQAAVVRAAWRTGSEPTTPLATSRDTSAMPSTTAALLATLPENLRAAVLAAIANRRRQTASPPCLWAPLWAPQKTPPKPVVPTTL